MTIQLFFHPLTLTELLNVFNCIMMQLRGWGLVIPTKMHGHLALVFIWSDKITVSIVIICTKKSSITQHKHGC